ncbi:MAG: DUF4157 domain-containing protein, partial [Bacteroidota bacterium]
MAKKSVRRTYRRSKRRSASQSVQDNFQSKIKLGEPGDVFEKQADRVADRVVSSTKTQGRAAAVSPIGLVGQTKKQEDKKDEMAQAKGASGATTVASPVAKAVHQSKGQGQRMPIKTQQFMERGIGADFSQVNIHTDQKAVWMNRQLKAQAFTHGKDVYFNEGKYDPSSRAGKHLLAHELTHVVQQGKAKPMVRRQDAGAAKAAPGANASAPNSTSVAPTAR